MRVSVVGLGPGPLAWISSAAIDRLRTPGARVFVRTRFFPNLDQLLAGSSWESFDELYETASSLDQVNRGIAERLLASGDDVVLAVPGDGTLGEAVLERLRDAGAQVEVVPGVPLGVAALAAAAVPASDGAQVVEATALGGSGIDLLIELNPRWPAVVTGVFSPRIAGDAKLALQRVYPADEFEWNDVVRNLSEKLVRRHPHVFGEVVVRGASDVVRNWDQLKAAERIHEPRPSSALDGVPKSLPQLKRAAELARKADKA